jgi:hypothetical protein
MYFLCLHFSARIGCTARSACSVLDIPHLHWIALGNHWM